MLFLYFKRSQFSSVVKNVYLTLKKKTSLLNQNLFMSCFFQLLKGENLYLKMRMFHEVRSH